MVECSSVFSTWRKHSRTKQEQLRSAFTNAFNKVSGLNQSRIVSTACEEIQLESPADAQLIVAELYHRVVRDGGDCFHDKYVQLFKALRAGYPDLFDAEPFPSRWAFCEQIWAVLLQQEALHFLEELDEGQRRRCIAVSVMRFLGHLCLHGLFAPRALLVELLHDDVRGLVVTCRKGLSLHRLLLPYMQRLPADLEFQTECACTLLEVIGPSFAVLDMKGLKAWCVRQLTRLHSQGVKQEEHSLTKRGQLLVQNFLELDWVAEQRVDPTNGRPYTLRALLSFYSQAYSEDEIRCYFREQCAPFNAAQEKRGRRRQEIRRRGHAQRPYRK